MEYVLRTNALEKRYRKFQALKSVNMNIPKGSIYGFVGKNGAGKTTLIRLICGLQQPTKGTYTLYGKVNTGREMEQARRRIGAVVETPSIYLNMTAEANMEQQYRILGLPDFHGIAEVLRLVGLEQTGKKKVKNFSLGMRQRLGIAIALAGNPDFLILDEPTNGLDPQGIVEMRELILKLNQEYQVTVLISSHILDELSKLATHYGFIDHGTMVKEITAEELENTCKKCLRVTITDATVLAQTAEKLNIEYSMVSKTEAELYGEFNITQFTLALAKGNCEILSIHERNESLESYYMSLVGGGEDE